MLKVGQNRISIYTPYTYRIYTGCLIIFLLIRIRMTVCEF